MTVKEIARKRYAGKECHTFEFDQLWDFQEQFGRYDTVMWRWKRNAFLIWLFTLGGVLL
jgi:hypothetical protein